LLEKCDRKRIKSSPTVSERYSEKPGDQVKTPVAKL
jgi:hypothetical protein